MWAYPLDVLQVKVQKVQVQSPRRITLYKPEFLIFSAAGENFVNFCCHAAKFLHFFAKIYEKSQNFGKNMQKYWNNLKKVPNIEITGKLAKYWNILKCIFVQNHNIKKLMVYLGFSRHNISRKKKYISIRIRPLLIIVYSLKNCRGHFSTWAPELIYKCYTIRKS